MGYRPIRWTGYRMNGMHARSLDGVIERVGQHARWVKQFIKLYRLGNGILDFLFAAPKLVIPKNATRGLKQRADKIHANVL